MTKRHRRIAQGTAGLIGVLLWFVGGVIGASTGLKKK